MPEAVVSAEQQIHLKQQVALRLEQHRRRRSQAHAAQATLPDIVPVQRPGSSVADSVAARFARKASYRDLLAHEAEAAVRRAEAAAEVARRNAEAIASAERKLLEEIQQWNQLAADVEPTRPAGNVAWAAVEFGPAVATTQAPAELNAQAGTGFLTQELPLPTTTATTATSVAAAPDTQAHGTAADPVALLDPLQLLKQQPQEPPTGLPTNLIEFPRQLVAARKARPRLAEGPLLEEANRSPERAQLRIFEVEPDLFSTVPQPVPESALPEWSSIRLDSWQEPHETAVPDAQVSLALPLYTAAVSTRCMAAAVDACCLCAVFLAAVATAAYASPVLPTGVLAAVAAIGTLALLGVLYLLLFFTLTDATPGMRYARIALCTFNDDNPTRSAMRRRLLATALSVVPMGLGLLWAALDDDRLGWHDRMSRTYQREY